MMRVKLLPPNQVRRIEEEGCSRIVCLPAKDLQPVALDKSDSVSNGSDIKDPPFEGFWVPA
jgi:hypothetical protein